MLRPEAGRAEPGGDNHRRKVDLPSLAEDPTAVPIRVSVEHPMERDHYIRSIEIVATVGDQRAGPTNADPT